MELRRFNIFLYSTIIPRVRFISELEFEHGTEEISLETALLDFEINSALVLRGGILLVPIGRFNQNHDGPQWEIIDRPLVSTHIIPSTYSDVGFGANGKFFTGSMIFTYDAYLLNGLGSGVIGNATGRTDLQSGKSPEMFGEDENSWWMPPASRSRRSLAGVCSSRQVPAHADSIGTLVVKAG